MKYPLEDLRKVRVIRRDKTEEEVLKAKRALQEAIAFLEQKKQELEEFKKWRLEEIERIYARIMKKDVLKGAVDDIHFDLATLDNKLLEYRKRVDDAQGAVQKAEAFLHEKQIALQQKLRELQKIEEHKKLWTQEELAIQDALQEKELEDFRVKEREESN
jgi:type III secretion protein O